MTALKHWWHQRSLLGKQTTVLLLSMLVFVPLIYAALNTLLAPTFDEIESKTVAAQSARAKNALAVYETRLQSDVSDYAVWDSSFQYLTNPSKAFEIETLTPLSYQNLGVDLIGYIKFDGTIVWTDAVDLKAGASIPAESRFFSDYLSNGAFFESARTNDTHRAYFRSSRGLYLVSSQWVVPSDGVGKPAGFMAMGTLLDDTILSEALQVKVDLNLSVNRRDAALLKAEPGNAMSSISNAMITTRLGLNDQHGHLLATVDFGTPRNITAAGRTSIMMATIAMIAALLVLLGMLAWANRTIAVRRLRALESYVRTMRSNDEPLPEVMITGADEIASLARQFKTLGEQLDNADEELRKAAYLQGKADSAAGMLHNVRNALAPIRVMQEKWLAEEALPFRLNMARATDELSNTETAPERQQQLKDFLISAASKIALTAQGRRHEMEETKSSIDQIAAILSSYNFDTSGTTAPDSIDVLKLLKHEIGTVSARGGRPIRFELPAEMPLFIGNRIQFSQVLGNILVNADEAMEAAGVPEKAIIVSVSAAEDGSMVIHLRDNGDGIAPDKLAAVFQRGYSTRDHKTGGLGMHWSANAMRAMGGMIAISSEGPGLGATVALTMRLKTIPVAHHAEIRMAA